MIHENHQRWRRRMRMHASPGEPTRGRTQGPFNVQFSPEFKRNVYFIIFFRLERADEVVEMPQAKVRPLFWLGPSEKSHLRSCLIRICSDFNLVHLRNILLFLTPKYHENECLVEHVAFVPPYLFRNNFKFALEGKTIICSYGRIIFIADTPFIYLIGPCSYFEVHAHSASYCIVTLSLLSFILSLGQGGELKPKLAEKPRCKDHKLNLSLKKIN